MSFLDKIVRTFRNISSTLGVFGDAEPDVDGKIPVLHGDNVIGTELGEFGKDSTKLNGDNLNPELGFDERGWLR